MEISPIPKRSAILPVPSLNMWRNSYKIRMHCKYTNHATIRRISESKDNTQPMVEVSHLYLNKNLLERRESETHNKVPQSKTLNQTLHAYGQLQDLCEYCTKFVSLKDGLPQIVHDLPEDGFKQRLRQCSQKNMPAQSFPHHQRLKQDMLFELVPITE